jgi:hypothetical protein
MAKKTDDFLDTQAMIIGYRIMLSDVSRQLDEQEALSVALKVVLTDQRNTITKRLEELQ